MDIVWQKIFFNIIEWKYKNDALTLYLNKNTMPRKRKKY